MAGAGACFPGGKGRDVRTTAMTWRQWEMQSVLIGQRLLLSVMFLSALTKLLTASSCDQMVLIKRSGL